MGAFTQLEIDLVRLRVLRGMRRTAAMYTRFGMQPDGKWPVNHVWFPEPGNLGNRELRRGNPPPHSSRPHHLRGYDLELDINVPLPPSVVRYLEDNKERYALLDQIEAAAEEVHEVEDNDAA